MHDIVIISGKGGSGKTTVAAAFAHLAENAVICDLDVDAPDLHILLDPDIQRTEDFVSGCNARIDADRCMQCGQCADVCRFDAVRPGVGAYYIEPVRCEGCKVCVALCPAGAIEFTPRHCGRWFESRTRFGPMAHALLTPGEENSGRLVMVLKKQARAMAEAAGFDLILSDGAPGVGCPVISSLSGTDYAVIVTEPTPSGRHDYMRAAELCDHFRIRVGVIINKYDLNPEQADGIIDHCRDKGYDLIGKLPFDQSVTRAMLQGMAVTEVADSPLTPRLRQAWETVLQAAGYTPTKITTEENLHG